MIIEILYEFKDSICTIHCWNLILNKNLSYFSQTQEMEQSNNDLSAVVMVTTNVNPNKIDDLGKDLTLINGTMNQLHKEDGELWVSTTNNF